MTIVRLLLVISILLCFLGSIWSDRRIEWALTGIYIFFVARYIFGIFTGPVIGSEIKSSLKTIRSFRDMK